MTDELEDMHARQAWLRKQSEPLDEDTIELLKEELSTVLGKCNRICNMLLNRSSGLGAGVIDATENIKIELARVRWYLEQRDKPLIARYSTDIRVLVEASLELDGPLGDAARKLLPMLPLDSQTQ